MANLLNSIIYHLRKAIVYTEGENGDPNRLFLDNETNPVSTIVFSNNGGVRIKDSNGTHNPIFWMGTNNGVVAGHNDYVTNIRGSAVNISQPPIVAGHQTAIGNTVIASKTQNIDSGTTWLTTGCSTTLTAGSWIIYAHINYASNATGRRGITIDLGGTKPEGVADNKNAVSGAATNVHTVYPVELDSSKTVTVYGTQNSGSALSQTAHIMAMRVV